VGDQGILGEVSGQSPGDLFSVKPSWGGFDIHLGFGTAEKNGN